MAEFDILITGGMVYDGIGNPPDRLDVGVIDDRIAAIGALGDDTAHVRINAEGRVVCPGFVDIHTHSDITMLVNPVMESSIVQGVTTEVVGNCGISVGLSIDSGDFNLERRYINEARWDNLGGFFEVLEKQGIGANILSLAGHNTVRKRIMGMDTRTPTSEDISRMRAILREAMDDGAVGFSTGLEYLPGRYAQTSEIVALAEVVAEAGGIYTTHLRSESDHLIESVQEALAIGREAHLPVELSHHKAEGVRNWGRVKDTLGLVDQARSNGQDVTMDQYPYTAYMTGLSIPIMPSWALSGNEQEVHDRLSRPEEQRSLLSHLRSLQMDWDGVRIAIARTHREYQGKTILNLSRSWKISPEEAVLRILKTESGMVAATYVMMSEDDVRTVMKYPHTSIASDAAAYACRGPLAEDQPHPRTFGTFPRILGRYVREWGVLTLENAIRKMTSLPAHRMGLTDRGRLCVGCAADIVVFDPETVNDCADDLNPRAAPVGIENVVVNGQQTVRSGAATGTLAGRVIRGTPGSRVQKPTG